MIQTLVTIVLIAISVIAILAVALFGGVWWLTLKQPPAYALIVEKYYVCPACKALHGGIFGKGPTKIFFPPKSRQWCWSWEWEEISRGEFKRLASEWYGVDWTHEAGWWHMR